MRRIDLEGKSKQELLDLARRHGIAGRSQLSKDGLIRALLKKAESKRNPAFESRGASRPAAGARRVEPLARRSAAQRDAKQEPKGAANRKAAGASAARPASTRPAPSRDTSARSADKRASKVSGPIRRTPTESASGKITRPPVRLAERAPKPGRASKESPARRSSSNAKEEAPVNKTGKTGAAKSGTGKSVTAKSGTGKPGSAKTPEKPAPSSQSGAKKSAAKPASSPKPQTIERAPSARRKAGRAQTSASRSGRGGPFGPEGERLHGGVKPPAGFSAMDLEGMDSARETERAHATAAVLEAPAPETPSARRGLGAPLAMPERYGRNYAVLMARDPQWVHVYWEIKPESLNELQQNLGDGWKDHRWVMRVFAFPAETDLQRAEEGNGEDRFDIELAPGAESWYVNVGRADRIYRVAIGIVTRDGRFHALARSNAVRTPRDTISHVLDEEWTRAPESYKRLYEMMGDSLPDGRSSAELGMLLRERLRADWSSGMMGSMASGALARAVPGAPGFWFVLDAELIVYGATEPDAKVTVQGRPVRLRPDGTFSLRFLLPDGTQVIDATAVSADGAFRKTITPTVRRETNATETVEMRAES